MLFLSLIFEYTPMVCIFLHISSDKKIIIDMFQQWKKPENELSPPKKEDISI